MFFLFLEFFRGDYVRRREDILEREWYSWEKKFLNCDSIYRKEVFRFIFLCYLGGYRCVGECFDGLFREFVF